jgi:ATP-dependent RNA helicase DDX51/DBP6
LHEIRFHHEHTPLCLCSDYEIERKRLLTIFCCLKMSEPDLKAIQKAKKKHKKEKKQKKKEKKKRSEAEAEAATALVAQSATIAVEVEADESATKKAKTEVINIETPLDVEAKRRKKLLGNPDKLPDFMKHSRVIGGDKDVSFKQLGIGDRVAELLSDRLEFEAPFPVQRALIPFVLAETRFSGGDALVMSATGSGKTLAFAVPVVELVVELSIQGLSCLCVLPTKDIALQVYDVFAQLCEGSTARVVLLCGDRSFFAEQTALQEAPQIVVCTPGRLRDHLLGSITAEMLHGLRWLVIDEGDRLLGEQYHQWLEDLMPLLRHPVDYVDGPFETPPLQKLVFSATMTSNPRKLAKLKLYRPVFFHTTDAIDVAR